MADHSQTSPNSSTPAESNPSYRVGYQNPPKHTQFKKGQSGNPKGRPKSNGSLFQFVGDMMQEPLPMMSGGNTMSKLEGFLRSLIKKASAGHVPSFRRFMKLARKAKLFDRPQDEPCNGVVRVKYNATILRAQTAQMRAERDAILARVARGELKELERIYHGATR